VEDLYTSLSDAELAARFDRGDREALNVLCRRHYLPVFRYAYHLTQNRPEAEDCTQEAFVRFVRSWATWRVRDRGAGPWLTVIARNVVVDHWKRAGGPGAAAVPFQPWSGLADPDAGDELLERERLDAVETALGRLGNPCRELIGLLVRKGLTLKRAAEDLGDSPEAVKKRYQRCLHRLQAELQEWIAP